MYKCPRCDSWDFEVFPKYGFCASCEYFEVAGSKPLPDRKIKVRKVENRPPDFLKGSPRSPRDQYSREDHAVLRGALLAIPAKEQRAVYLRFWRNERKYEIAEKLGISEKRVEEILASAYEKLRVLCLTSPRFSCALKKIETMAA